MRIRNKFRGCLVGGAVGDALGYSVEFLSLDQIKQRYGDSGIREYSLKNGSALISDDTQMTLFTANGLLTWKTRGMVRGIASAPIDYCWTCYKAWLKTQSGDYDNWANSIKDPAGEYPWLIRIPELHHARAPGNTVLRALTDGVSGTMVQPQNNSKGCGGLMRVAPVGLYFEENADLTIEQICVHGAEIAALTHGHPLGYIPAATFVFLINRVAHCEQGCNDLDQLVFECIEYMKILFKGKALIADFVEIIIRAVELSGKDLDDEKAISILGEGWVADQTLAIAVYCFLKHQDDFEQALVASVNHSGDSDSTGSVTGNLMGALHGYDAIPLKCKANLELKDVILEVADDLHHDCTTYGDDKWYNKYIC